MLINDVYHFLQLPASEIVARIDTAPKNDGAHILLTHALCDGITLELSSHPSDFLLWWYFHENLTQFTNQSSMMDGIK